MELHELQYKLINFLERTYGGSIGLPSKIFDVIPPSDTLGLVAELRKLDWIRDNKIVVPDDIDQFLTVEDLAFALAHSRDSPTKIGKLTEEQHPTPLIVRSSEPNARYPAKRPPIWRQRITAFRNRWTKVRSSNGDTTCTLWFGTNRKLFDVQNPAEGFGRERDSQVHVGICTVHVPESHKIGSTGSPWWKRLFTGVDDRLAIKTIQPLSADEFWVSVLARLSQLQIKDREAIIFVHGYNVTFYEAALRSAQLATDLAIKGCMAFFSWPSKGMIQHYIFDEASIDASESVITQFLVDFTEKSGASKVHIIAHSMGNRAVLRAINRIAATATQRTGKLFDQIILAAPDVDADVFRDLSKAYTQVSQRTTLYVSSKDWAVDAARWLHGYPRAGLLPPVMVVPGIDTVNVTHADLTKLGHGYVAEARLVLTDMHTLLRFGALPKDRMGLQLQNAENGQTYWLIGR